MRAEHAAGAKGTVKSVVSGPTHVPTVELAQTEPEGATQEENNSRTCSVHSTNVGRADMLHPFTVAIVEEPRPEKMPPMFEKYDRSGDPEEQLRSFMDAMAIYSLNDLVWCRVFSLSLKGESLAWFHSFRPHTIDDFCTLRNLFEQKFASNRA